MIDLKEKTEDKYKLAIIAYLEKRVEVDSTLKEALQKENKTLDGCLSYVRSEAKKQAMNNCAVISDQDVYDMVVHYILEDELNSEPSEAEKASISKKEKVSDEKYEKLVAENDRLNREIARLQEEITKLKGSTKDAVKESMPLFADLF